jgi:hypothetical protein
MALSNTNLGLLGGERNILAQPDSETFESEIVSLVKPGDETIGHFGIGGDARTVDGEKSVGDGESGALVTIDEGMVLREAFPKGVRLLDQVGVIAGLRPAEGDFK